nr:protein suppressor of fri 4 [Quercus suber]
MSKKRKDIPDLQEALDKRWCYYCERIFQDDKVLCDHQRYKHFRCDWDQQYSCGKKFTTAGGLSVHMTQVHKTKLEKIQNTIEGRENPAVEIFGMLGIPQELLDAHRREIETQYYQAEAEHRARTGNPLRGPNPNAGKKQVEELTHEEKMAKLEAHRAKNRANKAAREAGFKDAEDQARQLSGQNNVQDGAGVGNFEAFSNMPNQVMGFHGQPPYNVAVAGSPLSPHPQFLPPAYGPNGSVSPGAAIYSNGYMSNSPKHLNNAFAPPPYGSSGFGVTPQTNGFIAPPQDFGGYQAPLPSQPRTTPLSQPSSNPLPAPTPNLPARPAFNIIPNFTREEMAQLHGAGQPPPGLNAHSKRVPRVVAPSSGHATDNKDFSASLADMINQEAQNAQNKTGVEHVSDEQDRATTTTPTTTSVKDHPKKAKNKKDTQVLKVQNQAVSLEELKAADRKYANTFVPQPTPSSLGDAKGIPWYIAMFQAKRGGNLSVALTPPLIVFDCTATLLMRQFNSALVHSKQLCNDPNHPNRSFLTTSFVEFSTGLDEEKKLHEEGFHFHNVSKHRSAHWSLAHIVLTHLVQASESRPPHLKLLGHTETNQWRMNLGPCCGITGLLTDCCGHSQPVVAFP